MKPALAREEPSKRSIMEINDMRIRLSRWGKELLDNHAPLTPPPRTDGTQLMLNNELWDAFCKKDRDGMLRLVKKGADPYFLERKVRSEESRLITWSS